VEKLFRSRLSKEESFFLARIPLGVLPHRRCSRQMGLHILLTLPPLMFRLKAEENFKNALQGREVENMSNERGGEPGG